MTDNQPHPLEISVPQLAELRDSDQEKILILDCREHDEREIAKIDGTVHIPMGEIAHRHQELSEFQKQRVVVHCHHGVRSLHVTHWLRSAGFSAAQSLAGGIDAWSAEIDENVPRY